MEWVVSCTPWPLYPQQIGDVRDFPFPLPRDFSTFVPCDICDALVGDHLRFKYNSSDCVKYFDVCNVIQLWSEQINAGAMRLILFAEERSYESVHWYSYRGVWVTPETAFWNRLCEHRFLLTVLSLSHFLQRQVNPLLSLRLPSSWIGLVGLRLSDQTSVCSLASESLSASQFLKTTTWQVECLNHVILSRFSFHCLL
jgi:hypothetical protein